ncbi:hypothetical protein [Carnobacterium sp.]|uniref:hypothetical protein n=1 Tax=Carnobacterium sp. TaxID=48221 RepID=UPI0028A807BD|nr:hypothetical protein [Carnobacterium sp.]
MKRYWKFVTISLIAVLAIAVFYLQPLFTKDQYPAFTFKTVKGDAAELKNLTLYGGYSPLGYNSPGNTFFYIEKPFSLTEKETLYDNQRSYFENLAVNPFDNQLQKLQKENKTFMRAKDLDSRNFFEDDTFLAYVAIDDSQLSSSSNKAVFNIQILNKNSKEVSSYTIDIPLKDNTDYLYLENIQIIDSALKVVTRSSFSNSAQEEYHVYHLDLGNQKVIKDDLLSFESKTFGNEQSNVMLLNDLQADQPEDELVFEVDYLEPYDEKKAEEDPDYYPDTTGREFFVYDFKNQTINPLLTSKENNHTETNAVVDKNNLYLYRLTNQTIEVSTVFLDDSGKSENYVFDLPSGSNPQLEWMTIQAEKLYLITPAKDSQTKKELMVYDLNSSDILYEGVIEKTARNKDQTTDALYIYDGSIN